MDASPERLAEVEDRLAALDKLRHKYGKSLDAVLAFQQEVAAKLNDIENKDEVLAALRKDLAKAAEKYLAAARTLSKRRYESPAAWKKPSKRRSTISP